MLLIWISAVVSEVFIVANADTETTTVAAPAVDIKNGNEETFNSKIIINASSSNSSQNDKAFDRSLYLQNRNLTSLDDSYWNESLSAHIVDASNNPLAEVGILHSDVIRELDLSFGELRWLQKGNLRNMTTLQILNLSNNRHLTTVYLESHTLNSLIASQCSISEFMLDTSNLATLVLSHNRIDKVIEGMFGTNSALKNIDLSHNDIKYIEEYTFIRMVNLEYLNLSSNLLHDADWAITLSKSLEFLNLSHNKISSIDYIFLRKAKVLNVSHNEISNLPEDFNRFLPVLHTLDGSGNPLRQVGELKASQLKRIDLRECKIIDIAKNGFTNTQLEHIDLRDNKLTKLDFVLSIQNVSAALLNDNPWNCLCNISLGVVVFCGPSNVSLSEYCLHMKEMSSLDDTWFREAANPVIWAPLVLALAIIVIGCIGFGIYKKRKRFRPYKTVQADLIQDVPDEEQEQTIRLFRAWQSWQRDRINLQSYSAPNERISINLPSATSSLSRRPH